MQENPLVLKINITYLDNTETTHIRGKGLWSMVVFASNHPKGEGAQISRVKNALNKENQDLDLIKGEIFRFQ